MTRVLVDPRCRLSYAWFYITGLREVLGDDCVVMSSRPFSDLALADRYSFDHYLALSIEHPRGLTKVVIDYRDLTDVDERAYEWADSYASVNLDPGALGQQGKAWPLGPGFGVGPAATDRVRPGDVVSGLLAHLGPRRGVGARLGPGPKRLLGELAAWTKLLPLSAYTPRPAVEDQIFYVATLWDHANCVSETNPWRAAYMRRAREVFGEGFIGGFVRGAKTTNEQTALYSDLMLDGPVHPKEWVRRTAESVAAFNNPAVWGCLGWKLPQFMALGKAIITVPLTSPLPEPLVSGREALIVESPEELGAALERLRSDRKLRAALERGALLYWQRYLAPAAVAARVLTTAVE